MVVDVGGMKKKQTPDFRSPEVGSLMQAQVALHCFYNYLN